MRAEFVLETCVRPAIHVHRRPESERDANGLTLRDSVLCCEPCRITRDHRQAVRRTDLVAGLATCVRAEAPAHPGGARAARKWHAERAIARVARIAGAGEGAGRV